MSLTALLALPHTGRDGLLLDSRGVSTNRTTVVSEGLLDAKQQADVRLEVKMC